MNAPTFTPMLIDKEYAPFGGTYEAVHHTTLTDGVKEKEASESVQVRDIAELILDAVGPPPTAH